MWPSASATCSAVRNWWAASSASFRSAEANVRRARWKASGWSGGHLRRGAGRADQRDDLMPTLVQVDVREAHHAQAQCRRSVVAPPIVVEVGNTAVPAATVRLEHQPPGRDHRIDTLV